MDHDGMEQNAGEMAEVHEIVPGTITIVNPRASSTPPMALTSGAFMTVLNGLDEPIQLVRVESEVAGMIQLHETLNDDGVMRMVEQEDGFTVEPGQSLVLQRGGKHIMLMELPAGLEVDQEIELTLIFAEQEPMIVTVPVVDIAEVGEMDHGN
jgi:copper(I)-binding protein